MKPEAIVHKYNLLLLLSKLGVAKAVFYVNIFKRRYPGLNLNEQGQAVGIKIIFDRYGRIK